MGAFKRAFSTQEHAALRKEYVPDLDVEDPQIQAQIREVTVPTRIFAQLESLGRMAFDAAPKVKTPTMVLQGTEDELVPPEKTRELVFRLAGPIQYVELPAGHDLVDADGLVWPRIAERVAAFATSLALEQGER